MSSVYDKLDNYSADLTVGGVAVVLGMLTKKVLKLDILEVNSFKKALEGFLFVTVCSIGGKEAIKQWHGVNNTPKTLGK